MSDLPPHPPPRRRSPWRRRRLLLAAAVGVVVCLIAAHEHVRWSGAGHVVLAAAAPQVDFVIVPGARIHENGEPYDLLIDRLAAALQLYQSGRAPRLLVSGRGGGSRNVDEVAAMRRWLESRGVPAAAIVDDPLGLRTLDTMQRSKDVFLARSAIVVSNPFHVERAVFLGRRHGLEVTGVAAPYGREYSAGTMLKNQGREALARVLAWLDAFVFGT